MAIGAADLKFFLTGAASHEAAQADPDASLGDYRSSNEITSAADNNVFDDVTAAEAAAGDTNYRGIGFMNDHASLLLSSGKVWLSADTGNAEDVISFEVEAPSNETNGTIETIANEATEPTAPSWSEATTKATGKDFPGTGDDLAAGDWFGIWFRRVISAAASAAAAETFTVKCEGDTPA